MNIRILSPGLLGVVLLVSTASGASAAPQANPPVPILAERKSVEGVVPVSGPKIHFPEMEFSFGTVKPGEVVRHDFKVVNLGDETLQITEVRPSCGCTTAGDWTRVLKPQESGIIPIQLDT